jgi:nitrate reductase gamma subunit
LTLLSNLFAVRLEHSLLEHACGKNGKHAFALLHLLILGERLRKLAYTRRKSDTTDLFLLLLLLVIIFLIVVFIVFIIRFLAMVRIAILFKILSRLLLTLHTSLSELLHHLEKLLPIILEKVVCNSENVTCEY